MTVDTIKISQLEKENIRLKENLFRSQERTEGIEHDKQLLTQKIKELRTVIDTVYFADDEDMKFHDIKALELYEQQERVIFESFKKQLSELRDKFRHNSADLCGQCMGETLEI